MPIDINDYFAIKKHLDKYWDKISIRDDQGDTPYNLRNCIYTDLFMEQKIIYPETTAGANFYLDNNGFFIDKTCFMITGKYLEYLQATLSSSLFEFAYKKLFSSVELGKTGYQYNKHALILLPIAKINDKVMENFKTKISKLSHNDVDIAKTIEVINEDIFKIYNLNSNEIKYLESVKSNNN